MCNPWVKLHPHIRMWQHWKQCERPRHNKPIDSLQMKFQRESASFTSDRLPLKNDLKRLTWEIDFMDAWNSLRRKRGKAWNGQLSVAAMFSRIKAIMCSKKSWWWKTKVVPHALHTINKSWAIFFSEIYTIRYKKLKMKNPRWLPFFLW